MILEYLIILIKSIISLPFIFFIPGFLLNSIYFSNNSLKFDSFLIFHIFVSIIITSFTALILAQSGLFSLFCLVSILFVASIILYQKYKKLPGKTKFISSIVFDRKNILITLLIISSVLLFFHPFPWIAGGRDPGVYVSTGVHIAKSGSILFKEPLIAQMNTSIQEDLYDVEPASIYGIISWANVNFKLQMPGFSITDLTSGTITPRFLHLFPVWIAIFYSIFGLIGVFYVNPVFATFSIIALYLLGKRLFSWKVGVIACLMLIVNFAQIWYARYPFAEIMTQFFIMSGLVVFFEFNKTSDRYLAIISALLFSLAFLTKIESLLLLVPLGLFFIYNRINKKWRLIYSYFVAATVIMFIYILIYYMFFSYQYFNFITRIVIDPPQGHGHNISIFESLLRNFKMISWYVSIPGIVLAIIGFCLIILQKDYKEKLLLMIIALVFGITFLSTPTIAPDHPWWVRRFVAVMIPLFALFAGHTLNETTKIKKIGLYLSYGLTIFLIISLLIVSYPIMNHSEGSLMKEGVSDLSGSFKDSDIIIMGYSFEGLQLSAPLYYIYDKKVIFLFKNNVFPELGIREMNSPEKVTTGIDYLLNQGNDIYLIINPNNIYMEKLLFYLADQHKIEFINSKEFSYKHLDSTFDSFPRDIVNIPIKSNIFKISEIKQDFQENISIDIGSPMDVIYLDSGFYGQETRIGISNRWTSGNASVRIPTTGKNNLLISIYCGSFRPDNISRANFSIYINEHLLGNFTGYEEYKKYNMTAPLNYLTVPSSTIRIRSDIWKPSEITGTADTRDLGINIEKITIEQIPN